MQSIFESAGYVSYSKSPYSLLHWLFYFIFYWRASIWDKDILSIVTILQSAGSALHSNPCLVTVYFSLLNISYSAALLPRHKTFVLIQERKAIEFEATDIRNYKDKNKYLDWIQNIPFYFPFQFMFFLADCGSQWQNANFGNPQVLSICSLFPPYLKNVISV